MAKAREMYLALCLLDAIEDANIEALQLVLDKYGASPNTIFPEKGVAPMHLVIGADDETFALRATSLMLQRGGSANLPAAEQMLTPLHVAANLGRVAIVRLLLRAGGNVELLDEEDRTPIQHAIDGDHFEVVQVIQNHVFEQKIDQKRKQLIKQQQQEQQQTLTPNKLHYNFDATSPYYVNITHRRKDRFKTLFPTDDATANRENTAPTVDDETNLFELTERNLRDFTRDSEPTGRRRSFIECWREKIAELRERTRISRRLDDIDRILNSFSESTVLESFMDEVEETFVTAADGEEERLKTSDETVVSEREECPQQFPELIEQNVPEEIAPTVQPNCKLLRRSYQECLNCAFFSLSSMDIVQISEEYIHTDDEAGVVFREKRMITAPSTIPTIQGPPSTARRNPSLTSLSTAVTLPPLDYDTDALRAELTTFGEPPGPITSSTKKLYLRKLVKLRRHPERLENVNGAKANPQPTFSVELGATVRKEDVFEAILDHQSLEDEMASEFQSSSTTKVARNLREGHLKKSFVYLLLDPRVSENLSAQRDHLAAHELWKRFLSAVFYVGKGKSSRPYCHLYDAIKLHHQRESAGCENIRREQTGGADFTVEAEEIIFQCSEASMAAVDSAKLNRIIDIWAAGKGVVCLHVFHNIMPAEAYTREAAIIDAYGVQNLTNLKRGDYYGKCLSWPMKRRKQLGILLLYKALLIHLAEGETQLLPNDLI
ncbi:AGAP011496-PA [Anopheles gambiae str. PEST]|uniref:AGAP011496-PA n=1 Tax=Anopheles gambiae TaxID=7165 RepID=Q5TPU6_ANOGA|nr:AGAP011496-PA [Anopheles gambiae str. PEST]